MLSVRRNRPKSETAHVGALDRLRDRFRGELDAKQMTDAEREVRDIVLRGYYVAKKPGAGPVRFVRIGCAPDSNTIEGFFVEYAPLSGGVVSNLDVDAFLEKYRLLASDCA